MGRVRAPFAASCFKKGACWTDGDSMMIDMEEKNNEADPEKVFVAREG